VFSLIPPPPPPTLFPYTTLFRSRRRRDLGLAPRRARREPRALRETARVARAARGKAPRGGEGLRAAGGARDPCARQAARDRRRRSEEHTSELQSRGHLVCRLLLE